MGFISMVSQSRGENVIIFCIVTGILVLFAANYILNFDFSMFLAFSFMCLAGFFTLKTAKEIAVLIEKKREENYKKLKANMHKFVTSGAYNRKKNLSKYTTSVLKTKETAV